MKNNNELNIEERLSKLEKEVIELTILLIKLQKPIEKIQYYIEKSK